MKRHAAAVRDYMTRLPFEAERCESVAEALKLMRDHDIHHLPVMSGTRLRGVVSYQQARLAQAESVGIALPSPDTWSLESIADLQPVVVSPVEPIDEVAQRMLEQKRDCAVIRDGGFVVGIFTATDALRFIRDSFGRSRPRTHSGAGSGGDH